MRCCFRGRPRPTSGALIEPRTVSARRAEGQDWSAVATAACVALGACAAAAAAFAQAAPSGGPPTDAEILGLVKKHCVQCHAVEPTHEAFAKPPAGIVLETIEQISQNAPRIMTQVVVNRAMPLGNLTDMTDEERNRIAAWIEGRK
jgi:uncharacterized membrane protein